MTKMEDLLKKALGKRAIELATELEGKKMGAITDLKELSALSKTVLAIKNQVREQKKVILSDYYKTKKANLNKDIGCFYLSPNHAKMIWQGNETMIICDKEDKALVGKEMFYAEANNCYGKIKIIGISQIDSNKFEELSAQHRFSPEEKQVLFGKNNKLFSYFFEKTENFEFPIPIASGELGFLPEVKFLSDKLADDGVAFENEEVVRDFILSIGSSELVNSLPEPDIFVRTIFELLKLENSLIKHKQGIILFEQLPLPKPNKVFYDKTEVLNNFFGGS